MVTSPRLRLAVTVGSGPTAAAILAHLRGSVGDLPARTLAKPHSGTARLRSGGNQRADRQPVPAFAYRLALSCRPSPDGSKHAAPVGGDPVQRGHEHGQWRSSEAGPRALGRSGDALLGCRTRRDEQDIRKAGVVTRRLATVAVGVVGREL